MTVTWRRRLTRSGGDGTNSPGSGAPLLYSHGVLKSKRNWKCVFTLKTTMLFVSFMLQKSIVILGSTHTHQHHHTYYSQVDAQVFIWELQRLHDSGMSDSTSARPNVIPVLRLRHLPQLMQHTHTTKRTNTPWWHLEEYRSAQYQSRCVSAFAPRTPADKAKGNSAASCVANKTMSGKQFLDYQSRKMNNRGWTGTAAKHRGEWDGTRAVNGMQSRRCYYQKTIAASFHWPQF